mgnify:CR=1 FL=1
MHDDQDNTETTQGERLAMWSKILEITEQLQSLAQRDDWAGLDILSQQREALLRDFFAADVPAELQQMIQRDIRHIQELDADVVRKVQKSRSALTDEINRLQTHRTRVRNYLSNSS